MKDKKGLDNNIEELFGKKLLKPRKSFLVKCFSTISLGFLIVGMAGSGFFAFKYYVTHNKNDLIGSKDKIKNTPKEDTVKTNGEIKLLDTNSLMNNQGVDSIYKHTIAEDQISPYNTSDQTTTEVLPINDSSTSSNTPALNNQTISPTPVTKTCDEDKAAYYKSQEGYEMRAESSRLEREIDAIYNRYSGISGGILNSAIADAQAKSSTTIYYITSKYKDLLKSINC